MMKRFWAICLIGAVALGAMANTTDVHPFGAPKRLVGKHVYDLQPLFDWWQVASQKSDLEISDMKTSSARPLPNWVHVTGRYLQPMHSGWQVDAEIYEVPHKPVHMTIILLHPPATEKKEFEHLLAEREHLQHNIDQAAVDHDAAAADAQYFRGQASYDVVGAPRSVYVGGRPTTVAPVWSHWENGSMHKKADRAEHAAESALVDKEHMSSRLSEVNAKLEALAPNHQTTFPIDCFAIYTGQIYRATGQYIYDCGVKR